MPNRLFVPMCTPARMCVCVCLWVCLCECSMAFVEERNSLIFQKQNVINLSNHRRKLIKISFYRNMKNVSKNQSQVVDENRTDGWNVQDDRDSWQPTKRKRDGRSNNNNKMVKIIWKWKCWGESIMRWATVKKKVGSRGERDEPDRAWCGQG